MTRIRHELDNSLKAMVAERIRTAIITGVYKPGARLVEQSLADELGISRGPVREAMLQLQQEGLIHLYPRRGGVVTTLTPAQCSEIYILRGHLESLAVRMVRPLWKPADSEFLGTTVREMTRLGPTDWMAAINTDMAFHHRIVDACGNQSLIQMYRSMDAKVAACFMSVKHHLKHSPEQMAERHRRLAEVLREGDFWSAEFLAADHWADTAARFRSVAAAVGVGDD